MTDAQSLAPCGTEAAYRRHRRAGETPCQDCKRAAAAARARRRGKADEQPPETMGSLAGEHLGGIVGPQELEQERHRPEEQAVDHDEVGRFPVDRPPQRVGLGRHRVDEDALERAADVLRPGRGSISPGRYESIF